LGLWEGTYQTQTQQWLDWWDNEGNGLLTGLAAYGRSQAIDRDLILALVVAVFFEVLGK
jgi:hypothetical protein